MPNLNLSANEFKSSENPEKIYQQRFNKKPNQQKPRKEESRRSA